jgi:hypothetical protein
MGGRVLRLFGPGEADKDNNEIDTNKREKSNTSDDNRA